MNAPDKLMVLWDGQTMKVLRNSKEGKPVSEEAFTGDRRRWSNEARSLFRIITESAKYKNERCVGFFNC